MLYFEDDLIVRDPWFFRKIDWFRSQAGDDCVVFPHRIELAPEPHPVDRFFIDGPMPESDLRQILPVRNLLLVPNGLAALCISNLHEILTLAVLF